MRRTVASAALLLAATFATPSMAQQTQPAPASANPTASSVNEEALFRSSDKIVGRVSIPDGKLAVLEQPQGRDWRRFHEGWLPWIAGIAILGMVLLLAIFYFTKGRIMLEQHSEYSGRKIKRFNGFERFAHWLTAVCFIVLALSGLNYIYGKRILQPLIGPDAFTTWSLWAKYAHNFLAWPFMLGILFILAMWVKDNIPNRIDAEWIRAGGGLFGGRHPSAGRFNAGQKLVFWLVVGFGILMSASGLMLLFPLWAVDVNGMQWAQSIHALIGAFFIAAIIAHIYIGTLGMEGAYDAMSTGEVDLAWAKAHHDLWADEVIRRNSDESGRQVPAE